MPEKATPYIGSCPIGCPAPLVLTDVVLAEGALRCCGECGQRVSNCTVQRYFSSMAEFDDPWGTCVTSMTAGCDMRQRSNADRRINRLEVT